MKDWINVDCYKFKLFLCFCSLYFAGVHEYPFLYARMFSTVAKFSSVVIIHFLSAFYQVSINTSFSYVFPDQPKYCGAFSTYWY